VLSDSSSDGWRRDSDRFLASLRSTDSPVPTVNATGGYAAYEQPDLTASSVSRQTYGYEADSSVTYSMPDITLGASVSDASEDSDAYEQPVTAQYQYKMPSQVADSSKPALAIAAARPMTAPAAHAQQHMMSSQSIATPAAVSAGGMRPLVRAWNEEYQRLWVRHLEANNRLRTSRGAAGDADRPDEELGVLLSIGQLVSDFTNAAMRIGRAIISEAFQPAASKTIKPVAVGGVGGGLKFVAEGIFFKFAVDEYDLYGGNEYAAKAANHEFRHLQLLMAHVIAGAVRGPCLHFPLMTLITFRGFRLIATTVLPIEASTIVYGSANAAVTVHAGADIVPVMKDIASEFNLAPHHVVSRDQRQRLLLHACADIEVHRGRDQRLYIIDCHRLMPPTMPPAVASPGAPEKLTPLRKNANLYYLFRAMFVRAHSVPLSSDAFSGFSDRVEGREHNRVCRDATVHLVDVVVPRVARALEARVARLGKIGTLRRIVEFLHRNGVNMRFVGYVRAAVTEKALRCALLTEMMARTIKQLLNTGLRKLKTVLLQDYCDYIYRLFNESIFGGRKLRTVSWWRSDGPAALLQRFARAYEPARDGDDLHVLIDERLLYDRLREITGVDFGPFDVFCGFMSGGVQHSAYTILDLQPVVHRLYVLPIFEATLLLQESTPPADAPFDAQTAFYEKVRQLYIEGLTTRPEDVAALDALGVAFKQHAVLAGKHVRGALALELFAEAFECFRDALEIAPKSHLAVLHFDYGVTLAAKARTVIDARRARLDDAMSKQVIDEMLADNSIDAKKRAHAEGLLSKLQTRMSAADADPLHAIDDNDLSALFTLAAQQFEVAARLDDRDADALYNRAHCILMAEIVMVVHGDDVAQESGDADLEREAKAERFRNSSGAGSSLTVPAVVPPRKMSASLNVDPTCDAALLGELRRKAATSACELAQTLCEQAVQLEIAASGVDPVGDEPPARAVALARLKNALEQDAASALKISGRRSPRSERRRERLQSLSPTAQPPVVRSWPPRREEVEREQLAPVQLSGGSSDDERSDEAMHPSERGFGLGPRVNASQ
jgi:tetratricopeptide (TPR) repeat protein